MEEWKFHIIPNSGKIHVSTKEKYEISAIFPDALLLECLIMTVILDLFMTAA